MENVVNIFCITAALWCPPYNVEFVDSDGECVYVCVDGQPMCPCITGPFDNMHEAEPVRVEIGRQTDGNR